jgi:hypothetical protein
MPKTYKHLYSHICAFDNLYLAHRNARRGGKRKKPEVPIKVPGTCQAGCVRNRLCTHRLVGEWCRFPKCLAP